MTALRFSDIDWTGKVISVPRSLSESDGQIIEKAPKSKNGNRNIEIDAGLVAQLSRHLDVMDNYHAEFGQTWNAKGWLFVQQNGTVLAPRALNRRFAGLIKRAGHASVRITMDLYGHWMKEAKGVVESHLGKIRDEWV